jgi:hypothetical protein
MSTRSRFSLLRLIICALLATTLVRDAAARQDAGESYPTRFTPALLEQPNVHAALAWLDANFAAQLEEWIRITEIPGTSRHEQERAAYVKAQLVAEGFTRSTPCPAPWPRSPAAH